MGETALEYRIREFTVDEYRRIAEVGIIARGERVELLNGRLVEMAPDRDRALGQARADRAVPQRSPRRSSQGRWSRIVSAWISQRAPTGRRRLGAPAVCIDQTLARLWGDLWDRRGRVVAPDRPWTEAAFVCAPRDSRVPRRGSMADVLLHHCDPHELGYHTVARLDHNGEFELRALRGIVLDARAFLTGSP